jgi:hypothetical protein
MTLRTLVAPALLVAALSLPARALSEGAEAPAAEAEKSAAPSAVASSRLQAAKRLYQKFDLDAAMAELKEAESAAKLRDNEEELVQVLVYKGLIFADQGKPADMTEHFKRALAMRPWTEMPPETSPRIAKQFADARRALWGSPLKAPPRKRKVAAAPAPSAPAAVQQPANVTIVTPPAPLTVPAPAAEPAPSAVAAPVVDPAPVAAPAPVGEPAAEAPKVVKVPAPAPESSGLEGLDPPK